MTRRAASSNWKSVETGKTHNREKNARSLLKHVLVIRIVYLVIVQANVDIVNAIWNACMDLITNPYSTTTARPINVNSVNAEVIQERIETLLHFRQVIARIVLLSRIHFASSSCYEFGIKLHCLYPILKEKQNCNGIAIQRCSNMGKHYEF